MNSFFSQARYFPAQIVLFRHAEKPTFGPQLSESGFRRAELLPAYFETHPILNEFGRPAAIIAASPERKEGSIRSIQTVTPLASDFKIQINLSFKKNDIHSVVNSLFIKPQWHEKTLVICWNRQGLPKLAELLGITNTLVWDKNCFDRFWVIRFKDKVSPVLFELSQEF